MRMIHADAWVLRAIMQGALCGKDIAEFAKRATNETEPVSSGSLYPALRRLEKEDLIRSIGWRPGGKAGRRDLHYYAPTDKGVAKERANRELVRGLFGFGCSKSRPESVSPKAKTSQLADRDGFDEALDSWISDEKVRHRARSTADKHTTNEMGRVILAWRLACKCDCAGCRALRELVDKIIISVHSGTGSKTSLGNLVCGIAEAALGLTTPEDRENIANVLQMLGVK